MRCMALAEEWQDGGGAAAFLASEVPPRLESRLHSLGMKVIRIEATAGSAADATATIAQAEQLNADWVVVDGDRFRANFLIALRGAGIRLLVLDDFADRESFPVDLLVNPNLGADANLYGARASNAQILAGPRYILLRREFRRTAKRAFDGRGNRVLITLGGSDPENLAPRIAAALNECGGFVVTLVVGPGYAGDSELEKISSGNFRVIVDPDSMAELMANADLAVIAAGGTLWELLASGCAVLSYSRNPVQSRAVALLARDGIVIDMGATSRFDAGRLAAEANRVAGSTRIREKMAACGRAFVDGSGAARVVEAMRQAEALR